VDHPGIDRRSVIEATERVARPENRLPVDDGAEARPLPKTERKLVLQ
jgi:hypothetical protein